MLQENTRFIGHEHREYDAKLLIIKKHDSQCQQTGRNPVSSESTDEFREQVVVKERRFLSNMGGFIGCLNLSVSGRESVLPSLKLATIILFRIPLDNAPQLLHLCLRFGSHFLVNILKHRP